jgi:hypothetical protein
VSNKDSGTDCTPFLLDTGASADIENVTFSGTHSHSSACNDAIRFGGTILEANNSPNAEFAGYHTQVEKNWFDNTRTWLYLADGANSIIAAGNEYSSTSGVPSAMPATPGVTSGIPTYCPVMSDSTATQTTANILRNNLYESTYVPYDVCQIGASQNSLITSGESLWDPTAAGTTIAYHFTQSSSSHLDFNDGYVQAAGSGYTAIAHVTSTSGTAPSVTVTGLNLDYGGSGYSTVTNPVGLLMSGGAICGYFTLTNTAGVLSAPVIQTAGPCPSTTVYATIVGPNSHIAYSVNLYSGSTSTFTGFSQGLMLGPWGATGVPQSGGAGFTVQPAEVPTSTSYPSFYVKTAKNDPVCPGATLMSLLYYGYATLQSCTGEMPLYIKNSAGTDYLELESNGTIYSYGSDMSLTAGTGHNVVAKSPLSLYSTTTPILLNGSAGTSGQTLMSGGAGATPTWGTPGSGISQINGPSANVTGPIITITGNGVTQGGSGNSTFTFNGGGWGQGLVEDTGCCTIATNLLVSQGDQYQVCTSSTSTVATVSSGGPLAATSASAATSGDCAGWYGYASAYYSGGDPFLSWTTNYVTSADYGNDRIWLGLVGNSSCAYTVIGATDTPTGCTVAAIRFSTNASDTYYTGVTCDASACAYTPIWVAPATGIIPMSVAINSGSVVFTVNGTSVTSTTTLPATNALMYPIFTNTTLSNTARYLEVGHIHGVYQSGRLN